MSWWAWRATVVYWWAWWAHVAVVTVVVETIVVVSVVVVTWSVIVWWARVVVTAVVVIWPVVSVVITVIVIVVVIWPVVSVVITVVVIVVVPVIVLWHPDGLLDWHAPHGGDVLFDRHNLGDLLHVVFFNHNSGINHFSTFDILVLENVFPGIDLNWGLDSLSRVNLLPNLAWNNLILHNGLLGLDALLHEHLLDIFDRLFDGLWHLPGGWLIDSDSLGGVNSLLEWKHLVDGDGLLDIVIGVAATWWLAAIVAVVVEVFWVDLGPAIAIVKRFAALDSAVVVPVIIAVASAIVGTVVGGTGTVVVAVIVGASVVGNGTVIHVGSDLLYVVSDAATHFVTRLDL